MMDQVSNEERNFGGVFEIGEVWCFGLFFLCILQYDVWDGLVVFKGFQNRVTYNLVVVFIEKFRFRNESIFDVFLSCFEFGRFVLRVFFNWNYLFLKVIF